MLVFVDESGDAGFTGKSGQTPYFVVAVVLFEDNDQAEKADKRIDLVRHELRLPETFEFRFHSCRPDIRSYFLQQMLPYSWFYLGIVINKQKLWSPTFSSPTMFYNYSTSLVFENAKPHLREAIVVIDASGGQTFRHELSRYLRRKIDREGGLIKKIKHQNSAHNNLIQLADMVAGSIYRSMLAGKKDRWDYRGIIRPKSLRVQVWPR
ncbi:MAG: DUF3800 domain-containing protein [Deltaproteobacteria bacterium]|nr:DUF3800 domain-containing protein [Deltaproteobacteria bacterium]